MVSAMTMKLDKNGLREIPNSRLSHNGQSNNCFVEASLLPENGYRYRAHTELAGGIVRVIFQVSTSIAWGPGQRAEGIDDWQYVKIRA